MTKRTKFTILLIILFTFAICFCACQQTMQVPVAITGSNFRVQGEILVQVDVGSDVEFVLVIDEGYAYVSNDCGGIFNETTNVLTLKNVTTPKTVTVKVEQKSYLVVLESAPNLTIENNARQVVLHGGTAVFNVNVEKGCQVTSITASNGAIATFNEQAGTITLQNVTADVTLTLSTAREFFEVTLVEKQGYTTTQRTVTVAPNGNAEFEIEFEQGYGYGGCDYNGLATYSNGTLTLKQITSNATVNLTVVEIATGENRFMVNVVQGVGYQIVGQSQQQVEYGAQAQFEIEINTDYYSYLSNSANATFDEQTGTLTLQNVTENTTISIELEQHSYDVTIQPQTGLVVVGGLTQKVSKGASATFDLEFEQGYHYVSNSENATFINGELTIENVLSSLTINIVMRVDSVTEVVNYNFGRLIKTIEGLFVTLTAQANEGYVFAGWQTQQQKIPCSYANNLVQTLESFNEKPLEPKFIQTAQVSKTVVYHPNGGQLSNSADSTVTQVFSHDVYLYPASMGELFFATFERDGYHVLEYNTQPDGSGTAISLGSRVLINSDVVDLYAIWVEESPSTDFVWETVSNGGNPTAIRLVDYVGTASVVTIPTTIANLPVSEIATNCFNGANTIETLVITKNVRVIEQNAITNCQNMTTLYLSDSVESVTDDSIHTNEVLANLRMIAVLPPTFSDQLIGQTVRRIEKLFKMQTESHNSLLTYGGSGMFYSLHGETMVSYFPNAEYVNCGQNAFVSGITMIDLYSNFMKSGDVMVLSAEFSSMLFSNEWHMPTWMAFESYYDALRYLDLRDYSNVFTGFNAMQNGDKENFGHSAKLETIKNGSAKTYEHYSAEVNEYFTRTYEATRGPGSPDTYEAYDYDFEKIKQGIDLLNEIFSEKLQPENKVFYMSLAAVYYEDDQHKGFSNSLEEIEEFCEYLDEDGAYFPFICRDIETAFFEID